MNTTAPTAAAADGAATGEVTVLRIRPRYEGANICTWIGFKHVNYLVEEAVLDHLRQIGSPPGHLHERYGLCVDLVDLDTRILHALHVDDVATAEVRRAGDDLFAVRLYRDDTHAVTAKVRIALRLDPRGGAAEPVPPGLRPRPVTRLGDGGAPTPLPAGTDPVALLTEGRNAYAWRWRIPYFYCHFTERVQMSGYLRLMEETVDLFLADRGISIKRLLDEQDLIPVVPHSRMTILDEALMEEELCTVLTVENVFKRFTYTARMDCYAVRDGALVPTATGRITHGYALIESRRDWSLVSFDDRMTGALER
jgi:acyl-CoA thioesterase FadM